MKPIIENIEHCPSTNTELASRTDAAAGTVLRARAQSAGRGQRGNSWESEPGRNLTFSLLLRPEAIPASRQFELSMLVSLGIVRTLAGHGIPASIKWPNDIYAGDDGKICGILIENTVSGNKIERSVIGVGLNVNQKEFLSDAPNPLSMRQLLGRETELEPLLEEICCNIIGEVEAYEAAPCTEALSARYKAALWRADGLTHPFRDTATGEEFRAAIADVGADGTLSLAPEAPDARIREYLFKEVEFLLK